MRSPNHRTTRHATRMLAGARRPRPTNYLSLAGRALQELITLGIRMKPFIEEKVREAEHQQRIESREPLLSKAYGPCTTPPVPPPARMLTGKEISQLLKDERALTKTQVKLAAIQAKLAQNR